MSAAWNDAVALLQRNREVMGIVAGVFFLLPGLVLAVLFAEQQVMAMNMLRTVLQGSTLQPDDPALLNAAPGWFLAVGLAAFFIQLIGYLALLALMDEKRRPTVGEAIGTAFKCLLPLIGMVILFMAGYLVLGLGLGLVVGVLAGLSAATGSTALAALVTFVAIVAMFVVIVYAMVRLSLVLAEMVLADKLNPLKAFAGSWRLTKGNSFRLFLFYLLLMIVYLVINMVLFSVLMGAASVFSGSTGGMIAGIISGLTGAAFAVLWTALMAAIWRQLSGPASAAIGETFE